MDVIIPTNLVYVLFDPAIPTSSFNFIQLFLYLYIILCCVYLSWVARLRDNSRLRKGQRSLVSIDNDLLRSMP